MIIVIQIGVMIRMIGKTLLGMFSNLEHHQSLGTCSKKQSVVVLSTCEAEYIAAAMAACQALWQPVKLYGWKL